MAIASNHLVVQTVDYLHWAMAFLAKCFYS